MANAIDLKQARVFIRDGYSEAGAVNNSSGYSTGATTVLVDGIGAIIATGTTLTFAGDDTVYEVLSHIETSSTTTSITITPGLVVALVDNQVITFLPNQIEIRVGEGNLTYEEKRPRKYVKNRGLLDYVKDDDQEPMDVTMDFVWDHIRGQSSEPPTIEEALKREGAASAWISSDTDRCQPYSVDIVVLYTPDCDDQDPERIVLPKFRYDSLNHNIKEGTIACKGACNVVKAVATRIAS